ncbi:unnamed protein product [Urochloa decumbens]|uniref:C3H1-type domain-containing protein n=1 Tax=Urochloa decumbens TaxID=240449 RepID=A0ABC8YG35_9POAL
MAGVEDEDEYKDALGAADPLPSSPSPTSKPKPAAAAAGCGGGGLGRRLFASIPLPASLSAAIGRFSSPKPPASNVGLGLLLHAGPATPADGSPAPDAASVTSGPHLLPLASLQRHHGEDQVGGLGAGVGEEELGLVRAEEQGWPTAEDREEEGIAVDGCAANRNDFSLRGQEEEGEQCEGHELRAAVDDCMVQDQEEVVEQEGATEGCAAVVEDQSTNAAVEQCDGDETRAVNDDNAVEVYEKVTEQEGAIIILDAAEDGVAVGLQEEDDLVVSEQGEDVISVQDQLEVVEQGTGDQLTTTTDDNAGQNQDLVEQEEETEYYTALEALEQCTNDGSISVKDGNIVEEEERAVEQEGALGMLDAAKDDVFVESQEEDVVAAEQNEDDISVQDQHKVVEQCTGDQLRMATDDNAAQDQDVVKQEGETEYYTAVEAAEQCTNDGSRAVKDDNVVEEKKVVEQEVAVDILDAAKDCANVGSQKEEDVMVAEQTEGGISVQDQHKVVEQCTGDQLKATADDNAAQDQGVLEQEGPTEYYTAVEAVEECTNDESRAAKDGNFVEEKERPVKQEGAVAVLDSAKDNIIVEESQEENVAVAEKCEGDISVQDQHKVVEQCSSGQMRTTMDDNAAEGQEVVDQEGAIVDRDVATDDIAVEDKEKEVKQSAGDESRATNDENAVETNERMVDQEDGIDKHGVIKYVSGVELLEENSIVVVEQGGDATSLPDKGNVVEQYTCDQLRATADDNAAENQEIGEQEGAIVERVVIKDEIGVEDQEKEVEQSAGDESTATKVENGVKDNEMVDREDVIDRQGLIKDGSGVCALEEDVVVTEQGGDDISVGDVGSVVKQCTSDQLGTSMEDNVVECQEVVEQEGAIFEKAATAGATTVEDQDEEVEQSAGDDSRTTKDEDAVEDAIDKQGAAKEGSGVESQEGDVVVAEQGGDDTSVQDEGNVVEQGTSDQQRTTADDNAAEDQEVVEQGVSVLGAAKVDIAVESREDIVVAEQVEDGVSVQDEQCTSDQLITSTDGFAAEDQEASREKIGFSAGYPQRPGKLNCRFYMSNGSCSYGSSCHYNHPQLKAKLEVSNFPSGQRNREVEFLELNRVGLPIREGARKCTYYMRNGTCRYGKKCCFNHPEQVLDVQLHMPTGWDDTNLQSSPHSKKSAEHATLDVQLHMPTGCDDTNLQSSPHSKKSAEHATMNDISSGSEILPPNILRMLLPPQNVPPCTEEKEMKAKKDPDWSSASGDSDGCCSADSSDGPLCKQEHVDNPERPECPFLRRFGNCKFASSCQYYHPKDKFPGRYHPNDKFPSRYHSKDNFQSRYHPRRDQPLTRLKVYPDRPGKPECPFYMKTGSCKFGADCKFHHPKDLTPSMQSPESPKKSVAANEHHQAARIPSMQGPASPERSVVANEHHPAARILSMQGPASPKRSVAANEHHPTARITLQDHMYQQQKCPERPGQPDCRYYMQFGKCKFQSACIFNHPKDILSSGWQPAECSFYKKTGTCQFGSACEFSHPKDRCSSTGEAIDDCTDYEHGSVTKSDNVLQQQEKTMYPERPGAPECSHYMKHGYCKFQNACKFHHPTDHISRN